MRRTRRPVDAGAPSTRVDATRTVTRAVAAVAAATGVYATVVRPRLLRWGATDDELRGPYPGRDLIPDGIRSATMAATINAPPERVWPWLVQMGTDRAGWYSWDRLDNFGRRSADRLHAEWQQIRVGDRLAAKPDGSESRRAAASLHGLHLGIPARGAAGAPHPARGERLLGDEAAVAPADHELRRAGTLALGHANQTVREPQAPCRTPPDPERAV